MRLLFLSLPPFLAFFRYQDSNATGAGTLFTLGSGNALTEVFDQNNDFNVNGTFTAPITGRYQFHATITVGGITAAMTFGQINIVTFLIGLIKAIIGMQRPLEPWQSLE